MAKGRTDPLAKRKDENDLQWRARVARVQETRRRQGEDVVTPERLQKGDLEQTSGKSGVVRSYRKRSTSSLSRLEQRGVITGKQLAAAQEIAMVAERIERTVGTKTASLVARVDCEGSGRDPHHETLYRVRMERAYSAWRLKLPLPRRMVLDMVIEDHQLARIAKGHNRSWRKAVKVLIAALDTWEEEKRKAFDCIDQDDVDSLNAKVA